MQQLLVKKALRPPDNARHRSIHTNIVMSTIHARPCRYSTQPGLAGTATTSQKLPSKAAQQGQIRNKFLRPMHAAPSPYLEYLTQPQGLPTSPSRTAVRIHETGSRLPRHWALPRCSSKNTTARCRRKHSPSIGPTYKVRHHPHQHP